MPARQGAKGYFAAMAAAQFIALARYTVLARLLGPEQVGLAAALILTAQFFDSITDSGSDRFVIQDRDGDEPAVQRLVQMVFVGRGLFMAACLAGLSIPIAAFFKAPQLVPGLVILALSPLIFGLLHLDMRRVQRHHDFRSEGMAVVAGEASRLVAFGLIVRSVAMVTVSHLRAQRPYRIGYSAAHARRLAAFALPLLLNGVLLFMGSHTDRVVVENTLGLAQLGRYSAVLLLIYYPAQTLNRYISVIHLPRIAATRDDAAQQARAIESLGGRALLLGVAMASGFAVVGPWAERFLFGSKFQQAAIVVALVGIMQVTRFLRMWPTTAALAIGRSRIVLANSVVRLIGMPAAFLGVALIGGLEGVAAGFAIGEAVAVAIALANVNRALQRPILRDFDRLAIFAAVSAVILGWNRIAAAPTIPAVVSAATASALLAALIVRREAATIAEALAAARAVARSAASKLPALGVG
ncbi:MAG: oligosaccharide flippase family protein [Caulobacteraceae bacterium]